MPSYLCSLLTADLDFATAIGADSRSFLERAMNSSGGVGHLNLLNRITYAYITPIIIAFGVFGDIMTVATLTHPLLRRANIIYTYLTLLAMTDLITHLSILPMILYLMEIRLCSRASAFYYAHIGFPLVNALMGASVWIVVFLTMSQYMAVCHPFQHSYLRSRKTCYWLFGAAFIFNFCIYAPWATKKAVYEVSDGLSICPFVVCDLRMEAWFKVYEWVRECITRILPFILLAFFNSKILITYKSLKNVRLMRLASKPQKGALGMKSEKEERRLFLLLFSIIIVFFVCTIPAAPLTIFVSDQRSHNLPFQVIRAIINVMEFTKFALNFYFYCLINPEIRRVCLYVIQCKTTSVSGRSTGRLITPSSIQSRLAKSRTNSARESLRRTNSLGTDEVKKKFRAKRASSNPLFPKKMLDDGGVIATLTVIREGDDRDEEGERTSML